eukprot:2860911-Pyramimonas_sp.AAC.3
MEIPPSQGHSTGAAHTTHGTRSCTTWSRVKQVGRSACLLAEYVRCANHLHPPGSSRLHCRLAGPAAREQLESAVWNLALVVQLSKSPTRYKCGSTNARSHRSYSKS